MIDVKGASFAEVYGKLRVELLAADEVKPRGMATKELSPAHFEITNPRARLGFHPLRKLGLPFAVADAVMLFHPTNRIKYLTFFNKNIANFSDDGVTMNSMYGNRLVPQMAETLRKLSSDHDTRQAVMPIVRSADHEKVTKDFPCTAVLNFLVRDGKLNLHVYMRSNDLYWGTPYDVYNFTVLQEVFANTLGLELGSYHHTATSLHVYEKHYAWLTDIEEMESVEMTVPNTIGEMRFIANGLVRLVDDGKLSFRGSDLSSILINEYMFRTFDAPLEPWQKNMTPAWAKPFLAERWEL